MKTIPHHGYFTIVAILRKLNVDDYILVDDRGNIDSMGKKIAEVLEMEPDITEHYRVNI